NLERAQVPHGPAELQEARRRGGRSGQRVYDLPGLHVVNAGAMEQQRSFAGEQVMSGISVPDRRLSSAASPFTGAAASGQADVPMVLHVRVVAGTGGGPDKTILRSAGYADQAELRMGAAYIHPLGDSGIETLREHARTWQS